MTQPAPRPKRPKVLVVALVLLPLAAAFFAMTVSNLGGRNGLNNNGLPSVIFLISLLTIWFNWARVTTVVLLAFQTVQWLPGGIRFIGDPDVSQAASYAVIASVLFGVGVVLVFQIPSNEYYRQLKRWRKDRRHAAAAG
ncbi:hypothetical protein JNUCC0626_30255 [Lentzea sp. JNUCC 0626]|uniref:hypothetical protein n=1 Tax=Lentzea sp. JNUCC 0626 TaxID=3367513 RepID=UPI00374856F2